MIVSRSRRGDPDDSAPRTTAYATAGVRCMAPRHESVDYGHRYCSSAPLPRTATYQVDSGGVSFVVGQRHERRNLNGPTLAKDRGSRTDVDSPSALRSKLWQARSQWRAGITAFVFNAMGCAGARAQLRSAAARDCSRARGRQGRCCPLGRPQEETPAPAGTWINPTICLRALHFTRPRSMAGLGG